MNADLRQLIHDTLKSEDLLQKNWSSLVLAACDGEEALAGVLSNGKAAAQVTEKPSVTKGTGAYLTSLAVEGFRGIGPRQTLTLTAGPGLTIIVGRNGSGKSSFAEALEVLLTGDNKRWADRSKVWKDGWRNLHQSDIAAIEADFALEGGGTLKVLGSWDATGDLKAQKAFVQPKGKPKTTLEALGWSQGLAFYRPFLSYNELGSMLNEEPSKKRLDALTTSCAVASDRAVRRALFRVPREANRTEESRSSASRTQSRALPRLSSGQPLRRSLHRCTPELPH